jgi:hypothetical protein
MVGEHVGALGEMLAGTEPYLEMERPLIAEQSARAHVTFRRDLDLREQITHELLLSFAELVPAGAAVKAVERQRIAGLERGHFEDRLEKGREHGNGDSRNHFASGSIK